MDAWQIFMMTLAGVGLSAACGFRVFVPPLAMCIAHKAGMLKFTGEFAWMGSDVALVAFSIATVLEIGAYYIPWLDNALDTIAGPAAVTAGTMTTAACLVNVDPWLQWTLAAIAGGGAAGTVQVATTVTRGASSALTGGAGNWVVSTAEAGGSVAASLLAVFIPIAAAGLFFVLLAYVVYKNPVKMYRKWRESRRSASPPKAPNVLPA